jgi:hypothetical protein
LSSCPVCNSQSSFIKIYRPWTESYTLPLKEAIHLQHLPVFLRSCLGSNCFYKIHLKKKIITI